MLFLLLDSPFLFAVQIIVYAGAIMVLFLFVIMLLGVDRVECVRERLWPQRSLAVVLAVGVRARDGHRGAAGVGFATQGARRVRRAAAQPGNAQALADVLFSSYFFPFEVTSLLLIVAAIAAMVLAQRKARGRSPRPSSTPATTAAHPTPEVARMRTPIAYFLVLSAIAVHDRHGRRAGQPQRAA